MGEIGIMGSWASDPTHAATMQMFGRVTMDFLRNDKLAYADHTNESKYEIAVLQWHIEDGVVVTDQESSPSIERSSYELLSEDVLRLGQGGVWSQYVRVPFQVFDIRSQSEAVPNIAAVQWLQELWSKSLKRSWWNRWRGTAVGR